MDRMTSGNYNHNLIGLNECIGRHIPDSFLGLSVNEWMTVKARGERMWKPSLGGSFEVFNVRPFPKAIVDYCVGDVLFLPALRAKLRTQDNVLRRDLIQEETQKRITAS